ncbi:MAG: hypothetical protein L3J87_02275 [Thermoplasmata archaeon]|nr:hypothetical protein [Thermoplasmata archaeon]
MSSGRVLRPSRAGIRWVWLPTVLFAALFALPAGALGVPTPVKHVAPFHGTVHVASTVTSSGCGASASLTVPPSFNLTTGVGRELIKSSVTGCGPPGFSDYAAVAATTGLDSSVVVMTAPTAHNFSLVGHMNASYVLSATPQSLAGGPIAWASVDTIIVVDLRDLTNSTDRAGYINTFLGPSTNGTATGNVSGYFSTPLGFTVFSSGMMTVVGHHYILIFWVELLEWTYAPSGTSLHASAHWNMATAGHDAKLTSWTLAK